jgi:hypothetical protein
MRCQSDYISNNWVQKALLGLRCVSMVYWGSCFISLSNSFPWDIVGPLRINGGVYLHKDTEAICKWAAWFRCQIRIWFSLDFLHLCRVLQLLSLQLSFQLHLHLLHLLALLCQAVLGMVLRWEMVKSPRILEMEVWMGKIIQVHGGFPSKPLMTPEGPHGTPNRSGSPWGLSLALAAQPKALSFVSYIMNHIISQFL